MSKKPTPARSVQVLPSPAKLRKLGLTRDAAESLRQSLTLHGRCEKCHGDPAESLRCAAYELAQQTARNVTAMPVSQEDRRTVVDMLIEILDSHELEAI